MKIAIVGWGVEGQSAYHYFGPEHEYLIVNEAPQDNFPAESSSIKVQFIDSPKPPGITSNVADLSYLEGVDKCDLVIYSVTSVKNLEKHFGADNKEFWQKAKTVQHIFFENVKTKNIIGVTGSKGKGTTSTLIYKLLQAQGVRAHLAGNIGISVLDVLNDVQEHDWVVLELTNYQLYKFPYSPHIAVCLMITEEHLDWHTDMAEYVQAKSNLSRHQTDKDKVIYYSDNEYSSKIAGYSKGKKIPYFKAPGARVKADGMVVIGDPEVEVIPKTEVGLLGEHNLQNVCAALTAVYEAVGRLDNAKAVLSSFKGLEHRLELVRTLNGIKYYDDSFGTNPKTAIVAIRAMVQPVVLITGGYDRGIPMKPLIDEILKDRVKHVVTIGQTGDKIAKMLNDKGFNHITVGSKTMVEAVGSAQAAAQAGDAILMSAAAASFDMYPNFAVRGNEFKKAVNAL